MEGDLFFEPESWSASALLVLALFSAAIRDGKPYHTIADIAALARSDDASAVDMVRVAQDHGFAFLHSDGRVTWKPLGPSSEGI